LLNEATKFAGIRFEDVTPVYLSFPQQIAALQNKALDGTMLIEPQATVAVNAGYGVRFMDTNEFYPHQQISVIFYSERFATQRKDVAGRFMPPGCGARASTTTRSRTERSPASEPTRLSRPWQRASI
jgi:ABC-type nitrate/sulfonate/bicarbonate transport systems, periplasmic components